MATQQKVKPQLIDDDPDYDLDGYYQDANEKSDEDSNWLFETAGLLGAAFVVQSLQPSGAIDSPVLADTPISVSDIPDDTFNSIMRMEIDPANMDASVQDLSYAFSDADLKQYQQMGEELKQQGRLEDTRTVENTSMRWAEQANDKMGMFGDLEAYKSGALDTYIQAVNEYGASIQIPWNPTGPNTCDECLQAVDDGPYPADQFPEPIHFGDQCNDPMADPVIVFPEEEVFSSWTKRLKDSNLFSKFFKHLTKFFK
ncbi:hypothetical protein MSWAN_1636 [Methanobacterium paludis]|uniref:Uncharacterized protein n=2 Tax=Methanobacterium paludis (strain DSM 25820 / JCM 18151 / SWAN1) TaxID=868131 RepID=F6D2R8_METPW|nr:hypothetical protein MSWAN_1636 [Methanobacterium paludis]